MKQTLVVAGFLLLFLLGFMIAHQIYRPRLETKTQEDATVLLEKIQTVAKLVTVEGHFSEVYNYQDYWGYDLPFLRKKALMRVQAKVSVGYDLDRMKIDIRPEEQRVFISSIPDPQIISIDHTIDYYDISEGTFNSFSEEDYNRLNKNARDLIEKKALESELFEAAERQGIQVIDVIRFMAESAGWTVVMSEAPAARQEEELRN